MNGLSAPKSALELSAIHPLEASTYSNSSGFSQLSSATSNSNQSPAKPRQPPPNGSPFTRMLQAQLAEKDGSFALPAAVKNSGNSELSDSICSDSSISTVDSAATSDSDKSSRKGVSVLGVQPRKDKSKVTDYNIALSSAIALDKLIFDDYFVINTTPWQKDVSTHIFKFLSTKERTLVVERVCVHFRQLVISNEEFKKRKLQLSATSRLRANWKVGKCKVLNACETLEVQKTCPVTMAGNKLAFACNDATVRLFDLTCNLFDNHALKAITDRMFKLQADGDHLLGIGQKTVSVWSLSQKKLVYVQRTENYNPCAAMHQDLMACNTSGNKVEVINVKTGKPHCDPLNHEESVSSLVLKGPWLVSGSHDKLIRVWNIMQVQLHHVLKGHTGKISTLNLSGNTLVSSCCDKNDFTVRVWDLTKGNQTQCLNRPQKGQEVHRPSVHLSDKGKLVVADHSVQVWDLTKPRLVRSYGPLKEAQTCMEAVSVWDLHVVKNDDKLAVCDPKAGKVCYQISTPALSQYAPANLIVTPDLAKLIVDGESETQILDFSEREAKKADSKSKI